MEIDCIMTTMREKAEAEIKFIVMASINEETQASRPDELPEISTRKVMEVIEKKLIHRSEKHQYGLREAARKVKFTPRRAILEYITKNRILRKDMAKTGCMEIFTEDDTERKKLQNIVNGLEDNTA